MLGLWRHELAPHKIKVLAVVRQVLFRNRLGAVIPALLRHAGIVASAIKTDLEVRPAARATLRTPRGARQLVLKAALPTMSRHCHDGHISPVQPPFPELKRGHGTARLPGWFWKQIASWLRRNRNVPLFPSLTRLRETRLRLNSRASTPLRPRDRPLRQKRMPCSGPIPQQCRGCPGRHSGSTRDCGPPRRGS